MSKNQSKPKTSKRQATQVRKSKQRLNSILIWVGLGIGAIAIASFVVWQVIRPSSGEVVPIPANYQTHIAEGTPPGPYPSDPPAGGVHYDSELPAKFYQVADLETAPQYPEGHLVHNLEHGYVIIWYNCDVMDEASCTLLKKQIQQVMDDFDGVKLIAFPWKSLNVPVAMTSWGQLLRFETFDPNQARAFVKANRNRAPEPNAP
jgi:hypothetical protein